MYVYTSKLCIIGDKTIKSRIENASIAIPAGKLKVICFKSSQTDIGNRTEVKIKTCSSKGMPNIHHPSIALELKRYAHLLGTVLLFIIAKSAITRNIHEEKATAKANRIFPSGISAVKIAIGITHIIKKTPRYLKCCTVKVYHHPPPFPSPLKILKALPRILATRQQFCAYGGTYRRRKKLGSFALVFRQRIFALRSRAARSLETSEPAPAICAKLLSCLHRGQRVQSLINSHWCRRGRSRSSIARRRRSRAAQRSSHDSD
jgi:hypothetical protein